MLNNIKIIDLCFFVLISILIFPELSSAQEKFVLGKNELEGFTLSGQGPTHFPIGPNFKVYPGIRQTWLINGKTDGETLIIQYAEFSTSPIAFAAIAYSAIKSSAGSWGWGTSSGSIIGDGTWVTGDESGLFILRGNVGVRAFIPVNYQPTDKHKLLNVTNILLNKIESNLSPEIFAFEDSLKQNQIPTNKYETITESVVNSELMNGFTPHSTWDSKWLVDSTNMAMGIRKEWREGGNTVIGFDICRFESVSAAEQAAEFLGEYSIYSGNKINLETRDSLSKIMADWIKTRMGKNMSILGVMDNIAINIYQYDSTGVDTTSFRALVKEMAEQIGNFNNLRSQQQRPGYGGDTGGLYPETELS